MGMCLNLELCSDRKGGVSNFRRLCFWGGGEVCPNMRPHNSNEAHRPPDS